jgi:hypothetical protein|tara:strand:+ start:10284 stop:10592 length:309 start_codon:yes stop_codon:yes gene_type:complete
MGDNTVKEILKYMDMMCTTLENGEEEDFNVVLRIKLLRAGMSLSLLAQDSTDEQVDIILPALEAIIEVYQGLLVMAPEAEAKESEKALMEMLMKTSTIKAEA